ncbi:MAG: thiamine biosynthesis protein ThiS [Betaproteobacteria bacterium HGW-Betaproteobacteria-21]|nr:MAG: thiamine biosynthesis protein ThiS [Betaproteobacteria bacterium HGW-Betaproteobacteria-21]
MPRIVFAPAIQRHVPSPVHDVDASTVGAALGLAFAALPALRGYILDDQGRLRRHLAVFVDGIAIHDRHQLSDPVGTTSEIYVAQALSGG